MYALATISRRKSGEKSRMRFSPCTGDGSDDEKFPVQNNKGQLKIKINVRISPRDVNKTAGRLWQGTTQEKADKTETRWRITGSVIQQFFFVIREEDNVHKER